MADYDLELLTHALLVVGLYALYPIRISSRTLSRKTRILRAIFSLSVPLSFDPAPLLYPIFIPVLVSLSLTHHHPALVLPNIVLSLSSLPAQAIPLYENFHGYSVIQWIITLAPIIVADNFLFYSPSSVPLFARGLDPELLVLIFPLQQALTPTLNFLLTTSLLSAELQLLATALINLLCFSISPQAKILNALLWLGGTCLFTTCRSVLKWEVALARVPSWKFRRSPSGGTQTPRNFVNILDHKICERLSRVGSTEEHTSDSDIPTASLTCKQRKAGQEILLAPRIGHPNTGVREPASAVDSIRIENLWPGTWASSKLKMIQRRRHTISTFADVEDPRSHQTRTTPSGRRKRSMAPSMASFLSMTAAQAQVRKWLYAGYIYMVVLIIILGPVREYINFNALQGSESFGWVIGYLLGNISLVRLWVVMLNLESWITIPPRGSFEADGACRLGWVEHLRHDYFGEANVRLFICAYWAAVLSVGMSIVLRLSTIVEVDTRRKVFHGMMVLMFLPITYMDPVFCALALILVLASFLLLDVFRASQLPPISRPLTHFIAPYTDGRDHRGPVIISHIFLLVGCAIPLWLSLADMPRVGTPPWKGWDVAFRDVSMVSGVVCVGMGDAAASLIGRRFGRLKWFWGGGKSLEGSFAFAVSVAVGLFLARLWLSIGGWPTESPSRWGESEASWISILLKVVFAAGGASATEAVLTGGNDNVIVPVVLWLLVRGLAL